MIIRFLHFIKNNERVIYPVLGWIIILTLLVLSLASCSPVKRLNNLQKKHPYLFNKKNDTIKIYDTTEVILPGFVFDTTAPLFTIFTPDGLTYSKENLTVNIKGDSTLHTIDVAGEVDTVYETVYKVLEVPVVKYETEYLPQRRNWMILIVLLVFGILIGMFFSMK